MPWVTGGYFIRKVGWVLPRSGLELCVRADGARSFRRLALVQVDCHVRTYGQAKATCSVAPVGA